MSEIVKTVTAEGDTYAETDTSIFEKALSAPTAILGITKDSSADGAKFYGESDVAVSGLVHLGLGMFIGRKYGDAIPFINRVN